MPGATHLLINKILIRNFSTANSIYFFCILRVILIYMFIQTTMPLLWWFLCFVHLICLNLDLSFILGTALSFTLHHFITIEKSTHWSARPCPRSHQIFRILSPLFDEAIVLLPPGRVPSGFVGSDDCSGILEGKGPIPNLSITIINWLPASARHSDWSVCHPPNRWPGNTSELTHRGIPRVRKCPRSRWGNHHIRKEWVSPCKPEKDQNCSEFFRASSWNIIYQTPQLVWHGVRSDRKPRPQPHCRLIGGQNSVRPLIYSSPNCRPNGWKPQQCLQICADP